MIKITIQEGLFPAHEVRLELRANAMRRMWHPDTDQYQQVPREDVRFLFVYPNRAHGVRGTYNNASYLSGMWSGKVSISNRDGVSKILRIGCVEFTAKETKIIRKWALGKKVVRRKYEPKTKRSVGRHSRQR